MTKTHKRFIIPNIALSIILLVGFGCAGFFYFKPQFEEIILKINNTKEKRDKLNAMVKTGMDYEELKTVGKRLSDNYTSSLYDKLSEDIYKRYLDTENSSNYINFVKDKGDEIKGIQEDENYKKVNNAYNIILPTYVEGGHIQGETKVGSSNDKNKSLNDDNGFLTDLKFANYIESIFYTFQLESVGAKSIKIGDLKPIDDYGFVNDDYSNPKFYYFTYDFNVKGRKADIIDFLYFLDNVGTIEMELNIDRTSTTKKNEETQEEEEVFIEDFLTSAKELNGNVNFKEDTKIKKSLDGFKTSNIFENQLIDIQSITFVEDLDTLGDNDDDVDFFFSNLKVNQGNNEAEVKVEVRFYLKDIPNHKIINAIKELDESFTTVSKELDRVYENLNIQLSKSDPKKDKEYSTKYNSLQNVIKYKKYLNDINSKKEALKNTENYTEEVYLEALNYKKVLDYIYAKINNKK